MVQLAASKGAVVVYTPPYCPRANAIEPMFKGMNDFIRANRSLAQPDPEACIERGVEAAGARAPACGPTTRTTRFCAREHG